MYVQCLLLGRYHVSASYSIVCDPLAYVQHDFILPGLLKMSNRLSILRPNNVVPLKPNSQWPTSLITSSPSRATPLSRVTKSSREDVVTSPRRESTTSPVCVRDQPRQPEAVLLCSGQSCLQLPEDTGGRRSDVSSDVSCSIRAIDVAGVGWRVRWRHLDVSEYVVSDFGFRRQLLSESLGMTQRKSIRSKRELERDIVSTAHRHISASQLPGAVKPSSRAATNFADLKEALGASDGHGWTQAPPSECRNSMDEGSGREWQRENVIRRRMRSNSLVSGGSVENESPRKRTGLCRGLTLAKPSFSSNSSSPSFSIKSATPLIVTWAPIASGTSLIPA